MSGLVAGRLAVVTGAGSGLGRAACQVLAREGATVVAADTNYDAAVQTITEHLPYDDHRKEEHSAVEMDVSAVSSVQRVLEMTLKQYERPATIVVNSAGILRDNWMLKLSDNNYNRVLDVNMKGTFLVLQAFAKAMVDAQVSGSIVNISSIIAKYGNMGQTNYAASKKGVIGLTQSAAKELSKYNIRVNAVLPGFIETPMLASVPDKIMAGYLKAVPLGRLGKPSEVGELIAFLSSDKSSYVTGATIDISGGY